MTQNDESAPLRLVGPEDAHTRDEWEEAAAAVLRKSRRLGEDDPAGEVWQKLARTTLDGIEVTPLGTAEDLERLGTAGRPNRVGDWDIRAQVFGPDAKRLNEWVREDLDGGVTSLWLVDPAADELPTLLDGVLLDLAPVVLDSETPLQTATAFVELLAALPEDQRPAAGTNLGGRGEDVVAVAELALQHGVLGMVVDATGVHDLGASDAQELAWSLATATEHLRRLAEAGIDPAQAAALFEFRYAVTDEQFTSIAKLRAARRLWARVLELSGVAEADREQRQHAVTSRPMMSKYDPYVNMLRTTIAAFAAGVAGAEAVTVLPFDSPIGQPESFGRRIARNTSALLISESHLARVSDPAGGSYAVERLTDELAQAAWEIFGRLEDGADLESEIVAVAEQREQQVADRSRPLTGLSEFPNLAETLPERTPVGDLTETVRRYGASYEALRDEPATEPVFLATMGPIAAHTARATFVSNLFAAGGIDVHLAGPTSDVDAVLAAYDGQQVVCLAGADDAYQEWGTALAQALRDAGAAHVIIAGRPIDGVDDSAAMGVDALAFLNRTREKLG